MRQADRLPGRRKRGMAEAGGNLSRFAAIFAGGTMISRVLGLVRDVVIAGLIPGPSRDAFIFAFKLPNMLRDMLGEGAANAAFVPVMSASRERDSEAEFRALVSAAFSFMIVVLALLSIAGVLLMPALPWALEALRPFTGAPPKDPEQIGRTVLLLQVTFPYLFFIGLAAFAMAPLFTLRHYATPSWAPALLNVALIGCALLFHDRFPDPAWALVLGVWLGGVAQLAVLLRAMRMHAGVLWPNFRLFHPGVRRSVWLLIPVVLGQAAGEVNKLVDSLFAYALEEGVVTALFFANRLVQLPLSIFGVAVAVAVLPAISRAAARNEPEVFRSTLQHGLRQSLFLVLPALAGLLILREPIVRLLFERGAFTPEDTARTATALFIYGLGLLSFTWVKVAVAGFYGNQDTRTPVLIAAGAMLLNILLNFALVGPFGFAGLAAATTISFTVNFAVLFIVLCLRHGRLWDAAFLAGMGRIVFATLIMAAVAKGVYTGGTHLFSEEIFAEQLIALLLAIGAAMAAYFGLCRAMRLPDLEAFAGLLRRQAR